MKLNVTANAKKGITFGFFYRIISIIIPFFLQTLIRYFLGADYIGIRGLFDSILTVLSMAELGLGTAIIYHMYKPIADDDIELIKSLLNLYRKIYFFVGLVILIVGCAIIPFIPNIIKDSYPSDINLKIVFLLYLINSVFSYWFLAYKSSLFLAYQRVDLISIINFVVLIISAIFQGIALIIFKNYYVFLVVLILATVGRNLISAYSVSISFPNIKAEGKVPSEMIISIKKSVIGLFIGNVCGITRNALDSIFITYFISLKENTIYTSYFFILSALNSISNVILSALLAGVGNQIKLNDKEFNYNNMLKINSLYMVVSGWMTVCFLCLVQPFIGVWMGYEYKFPFYIAVLFPIYFYISKLGDIRGVYSDGAGLFWQNRIRCYIEIVANLALNYIFLRLFGTFGIVLATILTLFFIGFIGSTIVIFKYYFINGMLKFLLYQLKYLIITGIISVVIYYICTKLSFENDIFIIFVRGIMCIFITPFLYLAILFKDKVFMNSLEFVFSKKLK